jgi:hypothetical protein
MNRHSLRLVLLLFGFTALAGACLTSPGPTQSPDVYYTVAVQTISARWTLEAGATAVAQLTAIASRPTSTLVSIVLPPLPTETPVPPTAIPLPSGTPLPCDRAEFVADINVPPSSPFLPQANFTKTWRVLNAGSCAWSTAYALVFASGDPLGAVLAVNLPAPVEPGQSIDISVPMIAPAEAGDYQGYWSLRNAAGSLFGIGPQAKDLLRVHIRVIQPPRVYDFAYDFTDEYCMAAWSGSQGLLPCPGNAADPDGSVVLLERPSLESRIDNNPALWTRPGTRRNDSISGQYPAYLVQDGDRFQAEVGCLSGSPDCAVIFQVDYRINNGPVNNLGSWFESSNGATTQVDIDLSQLAGIQVQFILTVVNTVSTEDANAFWLLPRIQNNMPATGLILDWHQQSKGDASCQELRVYQTGAASGFAYAYTCGANPTLIASDQLVQDEMYQFLAWQARLKSFEGEVYSAAAGGPVTVYFTFYGFGTADAANDDIQAIQTLAKRIYARIAP